LIDFISLLAEAQPTTPTGAPSPEVLKALDELMKTLTGHAPMAESWFTPTGATAIAALINAIAWPALALLVIIRFSPQLAVLLRRVTKFELFGVKAEVQTELDESAQEAAAKSGLSKAPSPGEVRRAEKVEQILAPRDLELVREQVDALAAEYETIRASMPGGDPRTRRMEVVVSKMRTIGRAAFPLRYDLFQSTSPGRRLQAIASLQILPDYEHLDWLADRIRYEKPFIAYHALIALNTAARSENAREHLNELQAALSKAQQNSKGLPADSDRMQMLGEFQNHVASLRPPIGGSAVASTSD
jgi:hypothetical protein